MLAGGVALALAKQQRPQPRERWTAFVPYEPEEDNAR